MLAVGYGESEQEDALYIDEGSQSSGIPRGLGIERKRLTEEMS